MYRAKRSSGFTLIEMLLVVGVIAILAIVVLVALKPAKRLADTRDARRAQDINQILTGIHECVIDKKDDVNMSNCLGSVTVGDTYEIVTGNVTSGCQTACPSATSDSSCLPLDSTLSDYFINLPKDPGTLAASHSGYSAKLYSNGMVVIDACKSENGPIQVSR